MKMENQSVISTTSADIEGCCTDIRLVYEHLMTELKKIFEKTQETQSYIQPSINSSIPHVNRLAEIMKEKNLVVGELISILDSTEDFDWPVNLAQSLLKIIQGLSSNFEESMQIMKSDNKELEKAVKTCNEEDKKAELFSNIANNEVHINEKEEEYIRKINQEFIQSRDDLNYVLTKLFPDDSEDMKAILHLLTVATDDDSYIPTQGLNESHVEFLLRCCLVETDPTDVTRIKFAKTYNI